VTEVTCPVCGASQWPTADCMACGHPLDVDEDEDEGDDAAE
jgi:hypothetical protein